MPLKCESELVSWISSSLASLLNFPGTEEIAKYLMTIESTQDVEDYLLDVLDKSNEEHVAFIEELVKCLESKSSKSLAEKVCVSSVVDNGNGKGARPKKKFMKLTDSDPRASIKPQFPVEQPNSKKNKKFVSIYSQEGKGKDVVQVPGRHICECEAKNHRLINNCTRCGRIVCEQEGSGPCLFCGNLVCSKSEQEILNRHSKKSQKLLETLMNSQMNDLKNEFKPKSGDEDALEKARKHKDKLLEFDRTSERRTQVIDDEADYYSADSNKWLSAKERKILRKKQEEIQDLKHASRKDRKFTIDFAGRKVMLEEEEDMKFDLDPAVLAANFGVDVEGTKLANNVKPNLDRPAPVYVSDNSVKLGSNKSFEVMSRCSRLQSDDLQTMSDQGKCLSMHQPYASMLVAGIKRHEGRTWYTPHRGRLWISSTVKASTLQENSELERFYRDLYNDEFLKFPQQYPTSCLLGSIDVVDCLGQEEYREKFPDGESQSPYVFICENPQELVLKFPMKGEHKIYNLDPNIHQAAQKALKRTH